LRTNAAAGRCKNGNTEAQRTQQTQSTAGARMKAGRAAENEIREIGLPHGHEDWVFPASGGRQPVWRILNLIPPEPGTPWG
jgi:hypothetical protein